jgi:Uma2 family endonuclease
MATKVAVPPINVYDDSEDPEYFEILDGRWIKKESVGRRKHSQLDRIVRSALEPFAQQMGSTVEEEWTVMHEDEKAVPDVTFSFPSYQERDGYLVAPAFLVVESVSPKQRRTTLFEKCRQKYHVWGVPYCWILDLEEEAGYEAHREMNGLFRLTDVLTAGPDVKLTVADVFEALNQLDQKPATLPDSSALPS